MMPILLALLVAAYPPSIDLAGRAGATVDIPLLLVGDGQVRIQTSEPLRLDEKREIHGKQRLTLSARIAPGARQGIYDSHLYLLPDEDDVLVTAQAVHLRTTVEARSSDSRILPGTQTIGSTRFGVFAVAILVCMALIGLVVWRARDRTSPGSRAAKRRTARQEYP